MKIKYHSKTGAKLKKLLQPARQPCNRCKEVAAGRSHQRQRIPHRIAHRGC